MRDSPPSPSRFIALFGGSFDPPHLGHLHLATAALGQAGLDEVRFLPCRESPLKGRGPIAAGAQRVEMLHLATAELPWAVVDPLELELDGPSYSVRTAATIAAREPHARLAWILGHDQWRALPRWREPERLAELVEFLVFARDGEPEAREGFRMRALHGTHPASSTAIRDALRHGRADEAAAMLPPAVAAYIARKALYTH